MDAPTRPTEAEIIQRAASGERASLAALTSMCLTAQPDQVTPLEAMIAAEVFARLAAVHGDIGDNMMLAGILRVRAHHVAELGNIDRAAALMLQSEMLCDGFPSIPLSEGVEFLAGVLTAEADVGDELAADRLNKLSAALSPADADRLRNSLNQACAELAGAVDA